MTTAELTILSGTKVDKFKNNLEILQNLEILIFVQSISKCFYKSFRMKIAYQITEIIRQINGNFPMLEWPWGNFPTQLLALVILAPGQGQANKAKNGCNPKMSDPQYKVVVMI